MSAFGKVRCLSSVGATTTSAEYAVLALAPVVGSASPLVVILDDNGDPTNVDVNGSNFEFSELYVPTKVV